jgi:hypothetical protein
MPRLIAASSSSVGITMFRLLDIIIHLTFVCLAKADGPAFDLAPVFKSRFNVDNLSYVKSDNRFGTHPRSPSANPIHDPNLTLRIPANPHLDSVKKRASTHRQHIGYPTQFTYDKCTTPGL